MRDDESGIEVALKSKRARRRGSLGTDSLKTASHVWCMGVAQFFARAQLSTYEELA